MFFSPDAEKRLTPVIRLKRFVCISAQKHKLSFSSRDIGKYPFPLMIFTTRSCWFVQIRHLLFLHCKLPISVIIVLSRAGQYLWFMMQIRMFCLESLKCIPCAIIKIWCQWCVHFVQRSQIQQSVWR